MLKEEEKENGIIKNNRNRIESRSELKFYEDGRKREIYYKEETHFNVVVVVVYKWIVLYCVVIVCRLCRLYV